MSKVRVEKLQELMKQEISDIVLHELKDPRIGFVTVTSVSCTEDLREAKIYVSIMGDEKAARDSLHGLNSSPEISFALDASLDYSDHIQRLLNEIHQENHEERGTAET